jgi:hypothetical protein
MLKASEQRAERLDGLPLNDNAFISWPEQHLGELYEQNLRRLLQSEHPPPRILEPSSNDGDRLWRATERFRGDCIDVAVAVRRRDSDDPLGIRRGDLMNAVGNAR